MVRRRAQALSAWLVFMLIALHGARDMTDSAPNLRNPVATGPVTGAPATKPLSAGEALLAARRPVVPVQGIRRSQLHDTFTDLRGKQRVHQALDIMAPWGTPVVAADDGRVARISRNRAGGLALYLEDPSGRIVYYYAHLAGYAEGLKEGQAVQRGDVVAYVGTTGNASPTAPHLHFAVQYAHAEGRWWKGEILNPYPALVQAGEAVAASPPSMPARR